MKENVIEVSCDANLRLMNCVGGGANEKDYRRLVGEGYVDWSGEVLADDGGGGGGGGSGGGGGGGGGDPRPLAPPATHCGAGGGVEGERMPGV